MVKVTFGKNGKERRFYVNGPHHCLDRKRRRRLDYLLDIPTSAWSQEQIKDFFRIMEEMQDKAYGAENNTYEG